MKFGLFPVWAVTNIVSRNIPVHVFGEHMYLLLLGIYLGVNFWIIRTTHAHPFPKWVSAFYVTPSVDLSSFAPCPPG